MNVNGAAILSAAVELITHFRNSFHVPERRSLCPGWAICLAEDDCRIQSHAKDMAKLLVLPGYLPFRFMVWLRHGWSRTLFLEDDIEEVHGFFKYVDFTL